MFFYFLSSTLNSKQPTCPIIRINYLFHANSRICPANSHRTKTSNIFYICLSMTPKTYSKSSSLRALSFIFIILPRSSPHTGSNYCTSPDIGSKRPLIVYKAIFSFQRQGRLHPQLVFEVFKGHKKISIKKGETNAIHVSPLFFLNFFSCLILQKKFLILIS